MKSLLVHGLSVAMACACICSQAPAQTNYQSSSLLPMPNNNYRYPISQASAKYGNQAPPQPSAEIPPRRGVQRTTRTMTGYNAAASGYATQHGPQNVPQQQYTAAPQHHGAASYQMTPQGQDSPEPVPAGTMEHSGMAGNGHGGGCNMAAPYGSTYMNSTRSPYGCNAGGGSWLGGMMGGAGYGAYGSGYDLGYSYGNMGNRCGWFGGANALIMNRDRENFYAFSVENTVATEHIQLVNNKDAEMSWSGGVEGRFGRYFACGQWAWEGVYWGIYPGQEEFTLAAASLANPGNLDGIHDWSQITMFDPDIGANATVDGWVDAADAHRIRRNFEFHNVELNFWNYSGSMMMGNCGQPRSSFNWGFGARFFQFGEDILFSAKEGGTGTVFDNGTNQVDWFHDVNNYLVGFQISGDGKYYLSSRCSATLGAKIGMYGNHMTYRTSITSGGNTAFVNNGPFAGTAWNLSANKNDFSFLAEMNAGIEYQISCRWKATAGYRAVAVTGVALAGEQIHPDLRAINDALDIDSNGSLILHGVYLGAEYNF